VLPFMGEKKNETRKGKLKEVLKTNSNTFIFAILFRNRMCFCLWFLFVFLWVFFYLIFLFEYNCLKLVT